MKVVVAIDSLKNSLTSVEAGRAIEAGVRKAYGGHPVQVIVNPCTRRHMASVRSWRRL